jgi:hypothetical protein
MDFGGKLAFVHIWHKTHSFFFFFCQGEWKKARYDRLNKHVKDTPWLTFICLFHLVRDLNQGLINDYNFWAFVNDCIIIRVFGIYHINCLGLRA